jgi:magnesium transporter
MPELRSAIGYPLAITVMLISSAIPLIYFRKKGWMK